MEPATAMYDLKMIDCVIQGVLHEAYAAYVGTDGEQKDQIFSELGRCAGALHRLGVDHHVPEVCLPGQVEVGGFCEWPFDPLGGRRGTIAEPR